MKTANQTEWPSVVNYNWRSTLTNKPNSLVIVYPVMVNAGTKPSCRKYLVEIVSKLASVPEKSKLADSAEICSE
jgi:hypothetical protein